MTQGQNKTVSGLRNFRKQETKMIIPIGEHVLTRVKAS